MNQTTTVRNRNNGSNVRLVTPRKKLVKNNPTRMETVLVTNEVLQTWLTPDFQRPITQNARLLEVVEAIKQTGGMIPGTLTIGIFDGKMWRIDGQHRMESFSISGLKEGLADVRFITFETYSDMADEFDNLNTPIVRMKPDDHLRALEKTSPALQYMRKACPFIGYGHVRRGKNAGTIVGMSAILRAWNGSATDTPVACGVSAQNLGRTLTMDQAVACAAVLNVAMEAWGRDEEYKALWTALNLTLCAWLYRQVVMGKSKLKVIPADTNGKAAHFEKSSLTSLTKEEFMRCLMSLSANSTYPRWLVGRSMNDRDRGPAYERIKRAFQSRLVSEIKGKRARLPVPAWSNTPIRSR